MKGPRPRRLRHFWTAALAALAALAFGGWARAERVALVRPADGDALLVEVFNRLTAELRLQDFEVAIAETRENVRAAEVLELVARRADALASVAPVRDEGGIAVQVWLEDRATGKVTLRKLQQSAGSELPSVLAIRAVDLLRASLRESGASTPRDELRPYRVIPDEGPPPPAPAKPWEIRGEALMIFDGPAVGSVFGAALGIAHRVSDPVRIGVFASGPLAGGTYDSPDGSAFVRQTIGCVDARFSFLRSHSVELAAGVAGGFHYLGANSTARAPLVAKAAHVWSAAGALGVDGSFRLTSNAGIGISLRAIALSPRAGVGVGNNTTVLQFPLLSASAGLLVDF
jgi:hypothetical protein